MSNRNQKDNKRIAKNTLFLYFRMMLTMLVGLYTSRMVLKNLGVDDFGIYNVIGGTVAMFTVISGSLSSAISRFTTFELGKGNLDKLNRIFATSVNIQFFTATLIVILGEILGLWFINYKMNLDASRIFAAMVVLQFSLFNFGINLVSIPFNAIIIAHEHMNAFAYISILEVALKLIAVLLLDFVFWDKLIVWAVMLSCIALFIRLVYGVYCKKHFPEESSYHFLFDKPLLKEMLGFASWNFIGDIAGVLRTQGVNMLLNVFFGTALNAARGLAVQVNTSISSFSSNFITAVRPQITKSYAQDDIVRSYDLTLVSSRVSFFLLFLISVPVIFKVDYVLHLWLTVIPEKVGTFIALTLILSMVETLSLPFVTLQRATGKVRNYQLVVGTLHLMNFPLSWLALSKGCDAFWVYYIAISLAFVGLFARVIMIKQHVKISFVKFLNEDLARVTIVSVVAIGVIKLFIIELNLHCVVFLLISMALILCVVLTLGLKTNERLYLFNAVKRKLKK